MNRRSPPTLLFLFAVAAACHSSGNATPSPDGGEAADAGLDVAEEPSPPASYASVVASSTWQAVTGAPVVTMGAKMDDLYFPSPSVGFAVSGPTASVYKTTDGGATWTSVLTQAGTYFRSALFLDEQHGFVSNLGPIPGSTAITDTNVLYETKNGGTSFQPVTTITGTMPKGICNQTMIDAQHLVALGRVEGPAYLLLSSDGGATWTSKDMNTQFSMLIDAHFVSPTEGILVGGSAGNMYCSIQRTTDGGATWNQVFQSKTQNSLCWKISFPSADVGYVSVQDPPGSLISTVTPSFAKTTDGGKTWTEMPLPASAGSYPGIGMGFITEDIGWVSADDPTAPTFRTTDGGNTWTADTALKSPINRFRFLSPTTAFAIGGTIWRLDVPWTGGDP
jgi:photosystem II stability/assembly factor-like uncharacterized protein